MAVSGERRAPLRLLTRKNSSCRPGFSSSASSPAGSPASALAADGSGGSSASRLLLDRFKLEFSFKLWLGLARSS